MLLRPVRTARSPLCPTVLRRVAPRPSNLSQRYRAVFSTSAEPPVAPQPTQSANASRGHATRREGTRTGPDSDRSPDREHRYRRAAQTSQAQSRGKFDVWCSKLTHATTIEQLDDVF